MKITSKKRANKSVETKKVTVRSTLQVKLLSTTEFTKHLQSYSAEV